MKKTICLIAAVCLVLLLGGCNAQKDQHISGINFNAGNEDDNIAYGRYENILYGIIIEYPETYERIGNFEVDGYISYEGEDGISIEIYVPDTENSDILTAEEYAGEFLALEKTSESANTKYGKTNGYKAVKRSDGKIRIDFITKGVDAFYRFAYICPEEGFTEENAIFQNVMSSIRIDDGIYEQLTRMSSRYTLLLEYAIDMQYITDANYVNHCLNNYETSGEDRHKQEALTTIETMKSSLSPIAEHVREEGEGYAELWDEIVSETAALSELCDEIKGLIENGDIEQAQSLCRTGFGYDLSDNSSKFVAIINAEIAEY